MKIHLCAYVFFEKWSYETAESGMGGSEQHQCQMAWRLARRGYDVVSYSHLPDNTEPQWRGSTWKEIRDCDYTEPGIWVIYRSPEALDKFTADHPGQRIWFMAQDEAYRGIERMTDERVAKVEKFIVLSPWHWEHFAKIHPNAKDKLVLSSNGIKCELIEEIEKEGLPERNPHKIVYTSSPDRGLECLLPIFNRAREWVDDLELHVYYGFNNIKSIIDLDPRFKYYQPFMDRLKGQIETTDRVIDHGRISQKELYKEMFSAGLWVYPTQFTETSCIACQPPNSKIFTKDGVKNIQDVRAGDLVLTHKGRFRPVVKTFSRPHDGWLYSLRRKKDFRPVFLTEEHPLAVMSYNKSADYKKRAINHRMTRCAMAWKTPDKLESRDYLTTPKFSVESPKEFFIPIKGGNFPIDEKVAFVLGVYCAEGWVQHRMLPDGRTQLGMIGTAHSIEETSIANQVCDLFGGTVRNYIQPMGSCLQTESWDIELAKFLVKQFGHGARAKRIPPFLWESEDAIRKAFVAGLVLGDGCVHKTRNRTSFSTTSESLAYGLIILLAGFGIFAAMCFNRKRKAYDISWQTKKVCSFEREHESLFATRITSITKLHYCGPVYNLEVEEDNSYVTDRTTVHNCMENQAMGAIPIFNPVAALQTNVQHGVLIEGEPYRDILIAARYMGEIVKLAEQPALQDAIRKEMMPWARKHFDWENYVSQWCDWIEEKDADSKEMHRQYRGDGGSAVNPD